jgi:CheY-like chemotaxis protein
VPDLVVLDLMLPDLSGFEVCKALRAQRSDQSCADHHADGRAMTKSIKSLGWKSVPMIT